MYLNNLSFIECTMKLYSNVKKVDAELSICHHSAAPGGSLRTRLRLNSHWVVTLSECYYEVAHCLVIQDAAD